MPSGASSTPPPQQASITVQRVDRTHEPRPATELAACLRELLSGKCRAVTLTECAKDVNGIPWNIDLHRTEGTDDAVTITYWRNTDQPEEPCEIDDEGDQMWAHANDPDCAKFAAEMIERLQLSLQP